MSNKTRQQKTWSVSSRHIAVNWRKHIHSLVRSTGIGATLLIGTCAGYAGDLPRPGDSTDAGDSYGLRDGSRVVLRRLVNEAAVKHMRSKSVEPLVRQARITGDPLVTIENGKSNIVDVYYSEDSQAVADLMNVKEDGVAVFPVLIEPTSRHRVIATDEIIVQVKDGFGASQAAVLFGQEGLEVLENSVPFAPGQYLLRLAAGSTQNSLTHADQLSARQRSSGRRPISCGSLNSIPFRTTRSSTSSSISTTPAKTAPCLART